MHIAFTGATGFVGKPTLAALISAGHTVSILVRKPEGQNFPAGVKIIQGRLDDTQALAKLVQGAACVIHGAGAIAALSQAEFFKVNFTGTKNISEAAKSAAVKRLIYVSSLTARMPEISPYAASKRAAEDLLQSSRSDGMSVLILRPCAVYGPGDKATLPLLAALQKRGALIPGTAKSRFSLINVFDLAQIIADAVGSKKEGVVEVDDLAGGHSWAELAAISFSNSGLPKNITYLPKALVRMVAVSAEFYSIFTGLPCLINRSKMRELYHEDWVVRGTNWPRSSAIGLAQGLGETLDWYHREGWLPRVKAEAKSTR